MAKRLVKKIIKFKWWSAGVGLVTIIIAYSYFTSGGGPNLQLATVLRRDITQMVSETGTVKPAKNVDLAFQVGGLIASVSADIGARVSAGQALVSLDASELNAELAKAKANLSAQIAKLAQDQIGLNNSYANVATTLNSAYTSANDAVRIKVDQFFTNAETNNPQLTFYSSNSQSQIDAQNQRLLMSTMLNAWISQIGSLSANMSPGTLEQYLGNAVLNLNTIESFLNILNNTLLNAPALSQSTISTYKGYVSAARSEVDSALINVNTLIQTIASEKAALVSDAATQKSYAAEIDNIEAQLSKTAMYSPMHGIVTKQDAKVGEIAAPNTVLTSVISDSNFEIDSNVPEVDIAKVRVGDHARVTLDAYGNDVVFDSVVVSIDPAETVIEGVATYLTKLNFMNPDSRIKPGMTANIDIVSATHKGVLAAPQRAIHKVQDKEFVTKYIGGKDNATAEVEVKTDLKGSDGYIEITSGVNENDRLVIPRPAQ